MKIKAILALLFLAALQAVHADTVSWTTSWNMNVSGTLSGGQATQSLASTSTYDSMNLPYYDGGLQLTRVRLIYSAPLGGQSDTVSASLSVDPETTSHFTSASLVASTAISSSDLFAGLSGLGDSVDPIYYLYKFDDADSSHDGARFIKTGSNSKGAFDLTNPATSSFSVARDYTTTVFDTNLMDPTSQAAILGFFSQTGHFGFQLDSTVTGKFARGAADTGSVYYDTAGTDSGTIEVIYDTITDVPEPGTWMMLVGGAGMLAFVQRLRRRF